MEHSFDAVIVGAGQAASLAGTVDQGRLDGGSGREEMAWGKLCQCGLHAYEGDGR